MNCTAKCHGFCGPLAVKIYSVSYNSASAYSIQPLGLWFQKANVSFVPSSENIDPMSSPWCRSRSLPPPHYKWEDAVEQLNILYSFAFLDPCSGPSRTIASLVMPSLASFATGAMGHVLTGVARLSPLPLLVNLPIQHQLRRPAGSHAR